MFEVEGEGLKRSRERFKGVLGAKRVEANPCEFRQSPEGAALEAPAARNAALGGPSALRGRPLIRPGALPRPLHSRHDRTCVLDPPRSCHPGAARGECCAATRSLCQRPCRK